VENGLISEDRFGQELDRKMWITKGARFNAHQRLMYKHIWSIATIAFLSILVIIITLIQYIPGISLTAQQNDVTSISAIALALFILILSLLEASKSHQMKAMELHNCARDVSTLYNRLRQILSNPYDQDGVSVNKQLAEIASKYDEIMNRCQENHDIIDYDVFRLRHKKDFNLDLLECTEIRIKSIIKTYLPYLALILIAPITITILIVLL